MTHDKLMDGRERVSREEAIEYMESLLSELIVLAAPQPHLQHLLRMAHGEARLLVHRHGRRRFEPNGSADDPA